MLRRLPKICKQRDGGGGSGSCWEALLGWLDDQERTRYALSTISLRVNGHAESLEGETGDHKAGGAAKALSSLNPRFHWYISLIWTFHARKTRCEKLRRALLG